MTSSMDEVLTDLRVITCDGPEGAAGVAALGIIDRGAIGIAGGRIAWVGTADEAKGISAAKRTSLPGHMVLPGFVDAHTHLVFAGSRIDEFARKMAGEDYRAIAASGGGIASTVRATRAADDDTLLDLTLRRAAAMARLGTTTVEIKSGYGLSFDHELRILRVAKQVAQQSPMSVSPTFLGAHTVPPEFAQKRAGYVEEIVSRMIPAVAAEKLADACDVYIDDGAFTVDEARKIYQVAKAAGLQLKGHVGQFRDVGGAELLAELGALSGDHLEDVSDAGIAAMARAKMTGVLLPAAWSTLRQKAPEAGRFRAAGVPLAVATDCNPGTGPCLDLPLCAALAVRNAGLTAEEAVLGITRYGARALGRADIGVLRAGVRAHFVVYEHDDPRVLAYAMGNLVPSRVNLGAASLTNTSQAGW